jgi:hypothetical protein
MSPTPIVSAVASLLTAEGNPEATVVRLPFRSIFEIRAVFPFLYGPIGPGTCVHCALVVELVPPNPASATYNSPSGPNFRPLGPASPVANTVTFADWA